ncbi:MAG: hypothetical protein OEY44_04335 [Candidatus Peregrinibacteria bacterium]|nr:hypothetical protein [Candidatus Peregrinibacteria bacterium]
MRVTDKAFRRVFFALTSMTIMLIFVLFMNVILFVPLNSKPLWIGTGIMYLGINSIYSFRSIKWKVVTLILTAVAMTTFLKLVMHWALLPSIFTALIVVSITILLYMTFIS